MSFQTGCIVSNLYVYTTVTATVTKIKEKNRFRIRFQRSIMLQLCMHLKY